MVRKEFGQASFDPEKLLPWQRQVEVALVFLVRAQESLEAEEIGEVGEEAHAWTVAQRVKNLTELLKNNREDGVDSVEDRISLPSTDPGFRRIYNTHLHEVRDIPTMRRLKVFRSEDNEGAILVEPVKWTRDSELVNGLVIELLGVLNIGNKDRIIKALSVDLQMEETPYGRVMPN